MITIGIQGIARASAVTYHHKERLTGSVSIFAEGGQEAILYIAEPSEADDLIEALSSLRTVLARCNAEKLLAEEIRVRCAPHSELAGLEERHEDDFDGIMLERAR